MYASRGRWDALDADFFGFGGVCVFFLDCFRIGYGVMGWGHVRIGSSNMAEYITYLRWSKSN